VGNLGKILETGDWIGDYYKLQVSGYRVPQPGDLYINKMGKIQRRKGENFSKRARKRIILVETW
jgi:hypothetical protein